MKLFLLLLLALGALSMGAYGQDGPPPGDGPHDERSAGRPNLLAELGLSREQVQQIRRANQERRPAMMQAQRKLREANRALDMAIYQDVVRDDEFQIRLREFQAAQAEVAKLRFESELSVRRILTPEQLGRFREIRQRFAEERREDRRDRRGGRGGRGVRPMQDVPARKPPIND